MCKPKQPVITGCFKEELVVREKHRETERARQSSEAFFTPNFHFLSKIRDVLQRNKIIVQLIDILNTDK